MESIKQVIFDKIEETQRTGEMERQLDRLLKKETAFIKNFTKEELGRYNELEVEKIIYENMLIEQAIEISIDICREIYK